MFIILTPIRCHEDNGKQASLLFGAAHRDSQKNKLTALSNILNDGNAFHFYNFVHCRRLLSSLTHHYLLKRKNNKVSVKG